MPEISPIPNGRPRTLGDTVTHYWLALSMAKAAGADVVAAFAEGRLDQSDWAKMIDRCRGCRWADDCTCWLAEADWGSVKVPKPCENRKVFEALRP